MKEVCGLYYVDEAKCVIYEWFPFEFKTLSQPEERFLMQEWPLPAAQVAVNKTWMAENNGG